jgi:molybdate transport system substrate-binding protein
MNQALIATLLASITAMPARAAEIHILSAAAMQTVFANIAPAFEQASGHKLVFAYSTMGAITERVLKGETADLVVGSTASMTRLVKEGRIEPQSTVDIARVGVGLVVPTGTPKPPLHSVDDFRRALLGAKRVVYADPAGGGAAGIHVAKLIERLGLAAELRPKTKYGAGGDVFEVTLTQGEGTLGLTQISEIVGRPGGEFVGALPEELQNYTGVAVGTPSGAARSAPVAAFIEFLKSPAAASAILARGMQPSSL